MREDQLARLLERLRLNGELTVLASAIQAMADLQERELRRLLAGGAAATTPEAVAGFCYLQGHFAGLHQVLAMLRNAEQSAH